MRCCTVACYDMLCCTVSRCAALRCEVRDVPVLRTVQILTQACCCCLASQCSIIAGMLVPSLRLSTVNRLTHAGCCCCASVCPAVACFLVALLQPTLKLPLCPQSPTHSSASESSTSPLTPEQATGGPTTAVGSAKSVAGFNTVQAPVLRSCLDRAFNVTGFAVAAPGLGGNSRPAQYVGDSGEVGSLHMAVSAAAVVKVRWQELARACRMSSNSSKLLDDMWIAWSAPCAH